MKYSDVYFVPDRLFGLKKEGKNTFDVDDSALSFFFFFLNTWRHGLHVFGKLAADAVIISADVVETPS